MKPNYYFENRCVIVTQRDIESNNIPLIGNYEEGCSKQYPSRLLQDSTDFRFLNVVITKGIDNSFCIDYNRNESDLEDIIGYPEDYSTQREFATELHKVFGFKYKDVISICGMAEGKEHERYMVDCFERMTDYLVSEEEEKANELLDSYKERYGYKELK